MNQRKRGGRSGRSESDEKSTPIELKLAGRIVEGDYKPLSASQSNVDLDDSPAETSEAGLPEALPVESNGQPELPAAIVEQEISESPEPTLLSESPEPINPAFNSPSEDVIRPDLSVIIPVAPLVPRPKSSPTTATLKKIPPPLLLPPEETQESEAISGNSSLAYYNNDSPTVESLDIKPRTVAGEKRGGQVFDDVELGLGDFSVRI